MNFHIQPCLIYFVQEANLLRNFNIKHVFAFSLMIIMVVLMY